MAEETTVNSPETGQPAENSAPTVEDLVAEIAALKGENAKQKNALNKALRENGEITKKYREKLSAEEAESEDRRIERENQAQRIAELEAEVATNKAVNRYIALGMEKALAEATAKAELSGDMDTVAANFNKLKDSAVNQAKAEWLKSRPAPGTGGKETTAEEFSRMNIGEKTALKRENPELYRKLAGK